MPNKASVHVALSKSTWGDYSLAQEHNRHSGSPHRNNTRSRSSLIAYPRTRAVPVMVVVAVPVVPAAVVAVPEWGNAELYPWLSCKAYILRVQNYHLFPPPSGLAQS